MNGGLVRLREILDHLTPSERKIAEFIIREPQRIAGMSIAQLALECGGSQAAVIRLCKSAGFRGYQELILKVVMDLQEEEQGHGGYQEIKRGDSIDRIIENVSMNNIQAIRDSGKILDTSKAEKAVIALQRAQRIFFFGIGASNLIAFDAQNKFMRINKTCFAFSDSDMQLVSSVMLNKNDVLVGISYSGETPTIIECMKQARTQGATTISITRYGNSSVSSLADISLHISSTENEIRSAATSSRITQLNLIDILYLGVASMEYDQSVEYLEKSRQIVRKVRR